MNVKFVAVPKLATAVLVALAAVIGPSAAAD